MVRNLLKSPKFRSGEENGKLIRNLHADQHRKLITSRESALAHAYRVWSMSATAIVSCPAHSQNERKHHNSASLGGVINLQHVVVFETHVDKLRYS